jgi:hypothetical protein
MDPWTHPHPPRDGEGGLRRLAVLGAGPVGLDAALAARASGFRLRVYEAAPVPAGHVRAWGHVRLFTPWEMNVSHRMRQGLQEAGKPLRVDEKARPTGHELVDRVMDPLWRLSGLRESLHTRTEVVAVGRQGTLKHEEIGGGRRLHRPFRILLQGGDGREWVEYADVVLDCTGTWGNPNTLGDGGIPAPGERQLDDRIQRMIPELPRERNVWGGKTILLAGAGHSAQTAARALSELVESVPDTWVLWLLRSEDLSLGAVEDDPLPGRRELTRRASALVQGASPAIQALPGRVVDALCPVGTEVEVRLARRDGARETIRVDRILSLTGGVGDHQLYRQLQVHECYATSGPMKLAAALLGGGEADCLNQESHGAEALSNPEPSFYLLGDKSYGRNNTFLLRTGWEQVDEIFGAMD